ncbi:MAG TPA: 30S ribosomal protein S18 [Aquificae bacterium]|nr:30S ribosomal protein S18 [Aquificota bacterium]
MERIKNRNLLDDNSKLINDGIFEYDELFNGIGGYSKIFFINEDILKELIHPKRTSGVCPWHQRRLANAIKRARHMALLPFVILDAKEFFGEGKK